jgi:carbon monoxide dehydrogenase subunit G
VNGKRGKSMNLEGKYEVKAPRENLFNFITAPDKIGGCLPGLKNLEMESENKFNAIVRVGIGFMKGEFKFQVEIVEKHPPTSVTLNGNGTGTGSNVDMRIVIELVEFREGTLFLYKADVKFGGLIAGLTERVICSVVEKTVSDIFECVRMELEKEP